MKIKYFSKRNMEKYQTTGRLVIRRPCPVKIFLVSRLDLSALCVQGQRNGQRRNFFTS